MSFQRMVTLASSHSPYTQLPVYTKYMYSSGSNLKPIPPEVQLSYPHTQIGHHLPPPHPQGAKGVTLPLTSGHASSHTDSASLGLLSCEIFN